MHCYTTDKVIVIGYFMLHAYTSDKNIKILIHGKTVTLLCLGKKILPFIF